MTTPENTPDPLRATLEARLNALDSEHRERNRILQWIGRDGGFDKFLNQTLAVEGAAKEIRGILNPPTAKAD